MVEISLDLKQKKPFWVLASDDEIPAEQYYYRLGKRSHKWRPPTDVYETEDAILIKVEIAGMREDDFSLILNDQTIIIQGIRQDQGSKRAFHQMEIRNGEFSTEIELIWPVDSDAVEAEYKNGFLKILLPKAKKYQIDIDE